jgi:hypothetical protein
LTCSDNHNRASPHPSCGVNILNAQGALVRVFGCSGRMEGEFMSPQCILIHPTTQDVVVVDTGNDRIQFFNVDGEYERCIGGQTDVNATASEATPAVGQLRRPLSATFDHRNNLIFCDTGNERVSREEFVWLLLLLSSSSFDLSTVRVQESPNDQILS